MTFKWQVPISMQDKKGWEVSHYMPTSERTDILVESLCGRQFNPGFATTDNAKQKCFRCRYKLAWNPLGYSSAQT